MKELRYRILELGLEGSFFGWEALQSEASRCVNRPRSPEADRLTRIAREDGGCNYHAPGVYDITLTHDTMGDIPLTVIIVD